MKKQYIIPAYSELSMDTHEILSGSGPGAEDQTDPSKEGGSSRQFSFSLSDEEYDN